MTGQHESNELAFAAGELDAADEALLAAIADLYAEADPMPDGLVERVQFELTLDALQAEVATLTQLDLAASGARATAGTEESRTVTVTAESITTLITISRQPDGRVRLDGWAVPGSGLQIEVLLADGSRRTESDADGRFVLADLPSGLAKLVIYATNVAGAPSTVVSPIIEL